MTRYDDYTDDLERTAERVRFRTINNREYKIKAVEPFGFWKAYHKDFPAYINEDSFTTPERAFMAIEEWERTQKERVLKDKPTVTVLENVESPMDLSKTELKKRKKATLEK